MKEYEWSFETIVGEYQNNEMIPVEVKNIIEDYMKYFQLGSGFSAGEIYAYVATYYEPFQPPATPRQIMDWLNYQSLHQKTVTKHNTLGRAIFNTI